MGIAADEIDFYDDHGALLTKLSLPAEFKGVPVEILSESDRRGLRDSDFGLVVITKQGSALRKFPVCDPGNAWLSAQYFQAHHDKLAAPARLVAARFIKQACQAYEVAASPAVDAYAERTAQADLPGNTFVEGAAPAHLAKLAQAEVLTKQATAVEMNALLEMPDSHFALVVHTGDGEVIRKYAMPDAEHVKKAAAYFDHYAMHLSPEHRHRFASSVHHRSAELGVALPDGGLIEKWASAHWNPLLSAYLEQRKALLPRDERARGVLDKLAALIAETDPPTMARALETFDRSTGLDRYYDRGLKDAWASTLDKSASAWSAEVDEHLLTEADLKKVAGGKKLGSYLGESFARAFAGSPVEIFESLPETEKVLIKQLATGEA